LHLSMMMRYCLHMKTKKSWMNYHLENLYEFSNGWLNEDNYQDFETDFKAEYVVEI